MRNGVHPHDPFPAAAGAGAALPLGRTGTPVCRSRCQPLRRLEGQRNPRRAARCRSGLCHGGGCPGVHGGARIRDRPGVPRRGGRGTGRAPDIWLLRPARHPHRGAESRRLPPPGRRAPVRPGAGPGALPQHHRARGGAPGGAVQRGGRPARCGGPGVHHLHRPAGDAAAATARARSLPLRPAPLRLRGGDHRPAPRPRPRSVRGQGVASLPATRPRRRLLPAPAAPSTHPVACTAPLSRRPERPLHPGLRASRDTPFRWRSDPGPRRWPTAGCGSRPRRPPPGPCSSPPSHRS